MSPGLLFGLGAFVTVVVMIGLALPIYGAILDGRDEAERKAALARKLSEQRVDQPSASTANSNLQR